MEIHTANWQMVIRSFPNACWILLGEIQSYHHFNVLTWSFLSWAITRACTAAKMLLYLHLYLSLVIGVDERNGHGCLKTPSPCPLALICGLQKPITLSHCDSSRGRNSVQKRRTQEVLLQQRVLWYILCQMPCRPLEKEADLSVQSSNEVENTLRVIHYTGHLKEKARCPWDTQLARPDDSVILLCCINTTGIYLY